MSFRLRHLSAWRACAAALLFAVAASTALASGYPERPIELVVPTSPAGGTDVLSRLFAEAAKKQLPQPFVVVNKPGAAGAIGMKSVLTAPPDGYRLAMVIAAWAILPSLGEANWKSGDFKYVALINEDPAAITVRADAPWKTIDEFLADAKKRPGGISIGNVGVGSVYHFAAAALEDRTGLKFTHVPFQGASPAVTALLGGHIDAVGVSPAEVSAHVAAGKFRVLAVMSDRRAKGFEGVPTLAEKNVPLSIGTWRGLTVPKATPDSVVTVLRDATRKAVADPAFRDGLDNANLGYAYMDGPAFEAFAEKNFQYFQQLARKLDLNR